MVAVISVGHSEEKSGGTSLTLNELPGLCDLLGFSFPHNTMVFSSPSQAWDGYSAEIQGVKYKLGIRTERPKTTLDTPKTPLIVGSLSYITTSASEFLTPEGISVEWTYEELLNYFNSSNVTNCEIGWACFVRLPSGWVAAFSAIRWPEYYPQKNTKIDWFFKRARCPEVDLREPKAEPDEVTPIYNGEGEPVANLAKFDDLMLIILFDKPVSYLIQDDKDDYQLQGFNGKNLGRMYGKTIYSSNGVPVCRLGTTEVIDSVISISKNESGTYSKLELNDTYEPKVFPFLPNDACQSMLIAGSKM